MTNPATSNRQILLDRAAAHAREYLATVGGRHAGPVDGAEVVRAQLGESWTAAGEEAATVIDALARAAERGTVATQGPRYFGFVTGGSLPVATAADWLVAAWDQNAAVHAASPMYRKTGGRNARKSNPIAAIISCVLAAYIPSGNTAPQ